MASNLSTAAPLKPVIRLAQAISLFEASLSDGQKVVFRNQRTQSLQCTPSTTDVMRITAEIDASRKAGGRCFGPRFTKFLHGVQQFAALGDVVVGSSQNVVACGVWSVVRMCLLAATNRASYLESLSLLLMEAGQSTRQHSDLALLYPRSKSLQSYIIEFFIVVVQTCFRYHRYLQKSALGKFTSSLNDSDIKEMRSNLLVWSKSIQVEITILIARRIETEAECSSRFRAMMDLNSKSTSQQQKQIALRKMLDRCSTHDYETTWRQIRKAGNTNLYAQMPEYVEWARGSDPNTLILVGKLGYGKSVTLANIVDDINLRIDTSVSGLAYFFCRHDLPESLVARTVIGALIRQIISLFSHLLTETEATNAYDLSQLYDLMCHIVPPKHIIYIILDGLDLCSPLERKAITEQLDMLRMRFNTRACVSRRLEPEIELHSFATEFPEAKAVRLPDNNSDIRAFIKVQLDTAISSGSLALGNPVLILDIENTLLQGSQHMFLWVTLQIQSICMMQTDHDIREALTELPQDLSGIYSRILRQATRPGQPLQSDIFKLILSARRPLTTQEMREALSVTPGNTRWDPAKILNSIYPALTSCGCLITIDEEEHTVRTVHPSVNQFLLQENPTSPTMIHGIPFEPEAAQALMSSIIITYLSYEIFGTELTVRLPTLDVGTAPSHIITSMTGTRKSVQAMALKLLRSKGQSNFDVSNALAKGFKQIPSDMESYNFQHYAKAHIIEHLTGLPMLLCSVPENFFRYFEQDTIPVTSLKEAIGLLWALLQPPSRWPCDEAYRNGLQLFGSNSKRIQHSSLFSEMFYYAIETNRLHAIRYLLDLYTPLFLDYHAAIVDPGSVLYRYPVLADIMETISQSPNISPSRDDISAILVGLAPLCLAISTSRDDAAQLLINNELIDLNCSDDSDSGVWSRPIGVATSMGNIKIVRALLSTDHAERFILSEDEGLELSETIDNANTVLLIQDYIRANSSLPGLHRVKRVSSRVAGMYKLKQKIAGV